MGFNDIFKSSFLNGFTSMSIGVRDYIIVLLIAFVIGTYIFLCYRLMTRKTFYSKEFAISLVSVTLSTSAIILMIQTSIVISLGMVGALSIVRFRTAVKEPLDLAFMFWAISVGIICGAGHADIALVFSVIMTAALLILDILPVGKVSKILVINAENDAELDTLIKQVIDKYCRKYNEKSRSIRKGGMDIIFELNGGAIIVVY